MNAAYPDSRIQSVFDDDSVSIIAEAGANHDGSVARAHALIDMAARAEAHAIKFQTYTAEQLVADPDRLYEYGPPEGPRQREPVGRMFDRLALPRDAYAELFEHARELGLLPFTTLFDHRDVPFAEDLGQQIYKVASSDVTYRPLLEAIADTGKPVILSGGKCTLGELDRAVEILEQGCSSIVLMHCVAAYPAPVDDVNLRILETYRSQYPDLTLGFSDHTLGIVPALGAVALGARVIEKHITESRQATGPDHWFSSDEAELTALVAATRDLLAAMGSSRKRLLASEAYGIQYGRRSIRASRPLTAGHVVTEEDLVHLRPGDGLEPFMDRFIVGRRLKHDVARHATITLADLE